MNMCMYVCMYMFTHAQHNVFPPFAQGHLKELWVSCLALGWESGSQGFLT